MIPIFCNKRCQLERIGVFLFLLASAASNPAPASERVLHYFRGKADGNGPSQLIRGSDGTLYGTTYYGGGGTECTYEQGGCGTVFELTPNGREKVLYAFGGGSDGAFPQSNLVEDASGNLYSTTSAGGLGWGTVFKLAPDGTQTVLYPFQGAPDGWGPMGNAAADSSGNIYGTTVYGGNTGGSECQSVGCGTVFKVAPGGTETVLHTFQGGTDGFWPFGGVVLDSQGDIYGTTIVGGGSGCNAGSGCGTIFKLSPSGSETVLYSFQGGSDGAGPECNLLIDGSGNMFGTTVAGGGSNRGTVFELAAGGAESVLYAFKGGTDGLDPYAGVVMDSAGNFYGTTFFGGGSGCPAWSGCGTAFKLAPDGTETVLWAFGGHDGKFPSAGLLPGAHGSLYGTTSAGGKNNNGVVFELKK